jgi:titin
LYFSRNGTKFSFLATLDANVSGYWSTGLNPATTYYYRVTAFNAIGESAPATGNATTQDVAPVSPSSLSATAISSTQIDLSWADNANNETGFKVYISDFSGIFSVLATLGANVTNYSSTNLNPATAYYYRVTAFNAVGESTPSSANATTADVVPLSPSGLSATTMSASQINLTWTDNANNETGFKVYISTNGTTFSLLATIPYPNVPFYTCTGLNSATTYYYRVTAFNAVGESAPATTNATTQDVVPPSPSVLSATAISATQINLSWTDNANNESGFKVYISTDGTTFSLLATLSANVTSYSSSGLNPATTYYYRVTVFNAVGESAASSASATTPDVVPTSPSGLSATTISATQINLSWSDNASNESGFLIERSTDGINFTQIGTVGAGVTTYTDSGLAAATTYYYRVRATNSAGNSAYSNIASATTIAAAPPAAPSNLTLTVISASQIDLHWNDNSSNETQFLIERSPNGSSFTQIATVGANVQSFSATGLQSNTRYYFRVRATNSAGNSAYSNTVNAKTSPH